MRKNYIKEIWFTTTTTGSRRAWYFNNSAFRACQLAIAEAEMLIATEQATQVTKPEFVGGWR